MRKRRQEIRSVFPFPVCQRADTVSVGSVPRSVPLGTPRKPLQGLDVPQFHDFRRIGEKNTEKRSTQIPGKRAPARPAPQAPCAPRPERRTTDPQSGESPPGKPVSRLVCGREQREHGRERETGAEGGKTPVFLPDSGRFPPDLFSSGNKPCSHISPQQRTEDAETASLRSSAG